MTRRVGEDTGQDILIDLGGQLRSLSAGQISKQRKLTTEEQAQLHEIQKRFDRSQENPFSFLKF
ncbi:MAG: hypothetical protein SFV18_10195 [Bryobacteraceae bacterium]|nr:hypothetical protein [Bryobacteraceae bacterium]